MNGSTTGSPSTPPAHGSVVTRRLWLRKDESETSPGSDSAGGFDALTDLFLGEVSGSRRRSPLACPNLVESGPTLRLAGSDPIEHAGSAGVGIAEPIAAPRPTDLASDGVGAPEPVQPGFIECVVVGNLPVMASAWAAQYVREVAAAARRTVAYLRIQAGFATLELVGGPADLPHLALGRHPVRDLDEALRAAAAITGRWVVRVDHADEPAVAARSSIRLLTLITGTDEAARVQAYSALKSLAERLPAADARPDLMIRVAVMSAAEPGAEIAGRRVVDTVRQFLGREVEHAVCSSKIRSTRSAQLLYNGRVEEPAGYVLQQLESVLHETATATLPDAPGQLSTDRDRAQLPLTTPPLQETPATGLPEAESSEFAGARSGTPEPEAVAAALSSAERQGRPAATIEEPRVPEDSEHRSSADAPDLVGFLPGARPLRATCPYAPEVRLAVGERGEVHLLAHGGSAAADEPALASLMIAAAWVQLHAPLLGAMAGSLSAEPPVKHLFTTTPRASRRLLETDVRVHALASVRIGGEVGWCCLELN